jgi:hypothetical protein
MMMNLNLIDDQARGQGLTGELDHWLEFMGLQHVPHTLKSWL